MSYEAYTEPEEIELATRKRETYETCERHGEHVARKQNTARKKPIMDSTLGTWFRHMKKKGIWKP